MKRIIIYTGLILLGYVLNITTNEVCNYEWEYYYHKSLTENIPPPLSNRFKWINENRALKVCPILQYTPDLYKKFEFE